MAIKIITPDEDEVPEDLMVEIALLKEVDHPNIVKYYGGYRKGDEIFVRVAVAVGRAPQLSLTLPPSTDCYGALRLQRSRYL